MRSGCTDDCTARSVSTSARKRRRRSRWRSSARFRRCSPAGPAGRSTADPDLSTGSVRTRLPVNANTALAIAGASGGTPGSPRPPSAAPERMNSTLMLGASASFGIGRSWKLLCATRPSAIVTSLNSAADRPKTMPPSTCAVAVSGLMTSPQSTAAHTRCTLTRPFDDLDFRDFGHDRAEALDQRDPATASRRRRRAPARHLGSLVERSEMSRRVRQQVAPVLQRILARRVRQLVDERFGEEAVLRVRDRAPRADPHVRRRLHGADVLVLDAHTAAVPPRP